MAFYLEIGRPWTSRMVSERSRVRIPTSALKFEAVLLQPSCSSASSVGVIGVPPAHHADHRRTCVRNFRPQP